MLVQHIALMAFGQPGSILGIHMVHRDFLRVNPKHKGRSKPCSLSGMAPKSIVLCIKLLNMVIMK